jgi:hypothetical protein
MRKYEHKPTNNGMAMPALKNKQAVLDAYIPNKELDDKVINLFRGNE